MAAISESSRAAQSADIIVGRRVKNRRLYLDMSQEELARKIDVTFQQVQKYESGTNRIAVGRMVQIAEALKVDPVYFIKGLGSSSTPRPETPAWPKDCLELVAAYSGIQNRKVQKQLLEWAKTLAEALPARE